LLIANEHGDKETTEGSAGKLANSLQAYGLLLSCGASCTMCYTTVYPSSQDESGRDCKLPCCEVLLGKISFFPPLREVAAGEDHDLLLGNRRV